jgi:hypothetical protein
MAVNSAASGLRPHCTPFGIILFSIVTKTINIYSWCIKLQTTRVTTVSEKLLSLRDIETRREETDRTISVMMVVSDERHKNKVIVKLFLRMLHSDSNRTQACVVIFNYVSPLQLIIYSVASFIKVYYLVKEMLVKMI